MAAGANGTAELEHRLERDGIVVLARYRDPIGGHSLLFSAVPIEKVEPAPFQRDLSDTHVKRLSDVVARLDHYLDPIVLVCTPDGHYWTPNGHHRLAAMRRLGAKAITALILTNSALMYQILALNTEKSPNLKDRALEVVRMARLLADLDPRPESAFSLEFDEAGLLTLGAAYERNARFSGSVYQPIVRKCDRFLDTPLPEALVERERRAERLVEIDGKVAETVQALKKKGFESPYLKAFVVARTNPLRFSKKDGVDFDETMDKMKKSLVEFDLGSVKKEQVSAAIGYGGAEE
jgi:ParB family chromosome partitioning protein